MNPNSVDITSSPWVRLIDNVGNADLSTDSRLSELLRIAAERTDSPEGDHDEFARSTEPARSSTRDSLHYLRSLLQSEDSRFSAEETSRALETLNQELDELGVPGWSPYNRHGGNRPESTASFRIPRPPPVDLVPPRPARRALWDQVPTDPSSMNNNTSDTHSDPSRPTTSYRSLRRRAVRPDLRSASNLTDPIAFPPLMPQSGPSSSSRDSHGRLKRRKLDSDDHREGLRGFNYGHRGQVVSGPLKMEIASCDGGTFEPEGDSSHPDNVLRNDQSVYCTKSSRCNIVLRHRGEAPFCLRKLVIKAPRTGFDSPIQEGMIFVSMTADDLLSRTAQYQIQYSHARRRRRNRRSGLQPSQEYLNSYQSPMQTSTRAPSAVSATQLTSENAAPGQDASDPQSDFRVMVDYDDNSDDHLFVDHDDDESPSVMELERVQEDEDECSDSSESTSDDEDDETTTDSVYRRRVELQRQHRRRLGSLVDPRSPHSSAPAAALVGTSLNGEVMKPHARFFIEREKSMVSIKFDPPPSGRYILIKLWSPRSDGNIDIQSIIAHGFAGPRFFPSGGLR
ncbi:hypothetical protein PDE_02243 [Penicillium oxalicum 114-2]|uniref:Uncharacterized protein n=1 Tax=Penicillium oxalicum (strain 114-2 / CGMCC 5302) TaxID=933388 RepID=S7Z9M6_PENO1|nr:hypothetical protein PDE_02243 [Penicillium oxalicum 114-2]